MDSLFKGVLPDFLRLAVRRSISSKQKPVTLLSLNGLLTSIGAFSVDLVLQVSQVYLADFQRFSIDPSR